MARLPRIVVPGMPHHVVQRGNRRLDVFFHDADRAFYLTLLRKACKRHRVTIWAYCLMRNHVHLIAVPQQEDSLAQCFSDAHVRYTRRINKREGWAGHLWQGRFGSSVLDEHYLLAAVRYVERNPVRAGIVHFPWQYRWSSAGWHVGEVNTDPLVSDDEILRGLVGDWRTYLEDDEDTHDIKHIEQEIHVSRPLGTQEFVQQLEHRLQRRVMRRTSGRPPKKNRWLSPII